MSGVLSRVQRLSGAMQPEARRVFKICDLRPCDGTDPGKRGKSGWVFWAAIVIQSLSISGVRARSVDNGDLGEVYGYETTAVEIATGYAKAPEDAPAVTTVLTAVDIEAMGVRTLRSALESVAGFQWQPNRSSLEIVSLRGLNSSLEGRSLLLIDGLPIAQGFGGQNSYRIYEAYPVENIERIEVIRGPGSALYGADAFAGVINVITKTASRTRSGEFGTRWGSFNTYEGWLRKNSQWGALGVNAFVSGGATGGQDSIVEEDLQTQLDRQFGTRVSLAPGPVSTGYERANADFNFTLDNWRLKLGYFGLQNSGQNIGIDALDPVGTTASHVAFGDLGYRRKFSDTLELTGRFAYMDTGALATVRSFPPGAFGGRFQRGVYEGLEMRGSQLRVEGSAFWSGLKGHVLSLGGGYYTRDLYKFRQSTNATGIDPTAGIYSLRVPSVGEQLVDLPGDAAAAVAHPDRDITFGFFQDEWQLARDWTMTTGVRVDSYSDFGISANPRAALVWSAGAHSTYRLSYGGAFRAPGYAERSNGANNPFGQGDPHLRPETLDSMELGTSWWGERYRVNATFFGVSIHDRIGTIVDSQGATRFVNAASDESGYGVEWESTWRPVDSWRLRFNYTWQHPTGRETSAVGTSPAHALYAEAQWMFAPNWSADLNLRAMLNRQRQAGDLRNSVEDYTVANLSLRRKRLFGNVDLSLSLRNLFDADLREPSPNGSGIIRDIPLEGINAFGELKVNF